MAAKFSPHYVEDGQSPLPDEPEYVAQLRKNLFATVTDDASPFKPAISSKAKGPLD